MYDGSSIVAMYARNTSRYSPSSTISAHFSTGRFESLQSYLVGSVSGGAISMRSWSANSSVRSMRRTLT